MHRQNPIKDSASICFLPTPTTFTVVLASWKDPNNDFKKTLKLTGVPTLLRYGTVNISKWFLTSVFDCYMLLANVA